MTSLALPNTVYRFFFGHFTPAALRRPFFRRLPL
jgi:hypothetical protein